MAEFTPPPGPGAEPAPVLAVERALRTGAGEPATAQLTITNHATAYRIMSVTALGVDASWLPRPSRSRALAPGESILAEVTLSPAPGTVAARYPLVLAVQALDPMTDQPTAPTALAEVTLVIDAPGQIGLEVTPADLVAIFGAKFRVDLRNTGAAPAQVRLEAQAPNAVQLHLDRSDVLVPAGGQVSVRGRALIKHPRLLGHRARHAYTITARSSAAPRHVEGSVTQRALLGPAGAKLTALVALVALWAALAVILIPKLATTVRNHEAGSQTSTSTAPASGAGSSGAGAGGGAAGAGGAGGSGGAGASGGAGGSGGSGGSAGSNGAGSIQLNGTVAGTAPGGVGVSVAPTSLVDENAQGATPVGFTTDSFAEDGLVPQSALTVAGAASAVRDQSTDTSSDGAWSFAKVSTPGYYLLTFAKPGFQTQRYIVDSSAAVASQPLKVTLVPGQGQLSGTVTGPGGVVGGASVSITDGINTLSTSSNSTGSAIGQWSVSGLSTPDTYLVTVSSPGFGAQSELVTLPAGGTSTVNLALQSGVASLVGTVRGIDSLGRNVGLGGITVTATDGSSVTRTANTVTAGPVGNYVLPDLPAPGTYTVTISGAGYLSQTQQVTLVAGQSSATVDAELVSATAAVAGVVSGDVLDSNGDPTGATEPKVDAGLTLTSPTNSYKITTTSDGSFRFNGVAPGTYVLTAQFAGLADGFATVTAVAGQTANASFDLHAQKIVNTSTITGFVGDGANPSGTLCSTDPAHCEVTFQLFTSSGSVVDTSATGAAPFVAKPSIPPGTSGPTSYTLSAANGLAPGLYKLTIGVTLLSGVDPKVPSYLPATVSVQVPLDGVAHAPQVSLFAAGSISGTISSTFDATGAGTYTNCVWAIPVGDSRPAPTDCTAPTTNACLTTGKPDRAMATINTDGSYKIDGLCTGNYAMLVVVTNPDFVGPSTSGPLISVVDGSAGSYNATIFRKGRIQLTLSYPDVNTAAAIALSNATLAAGSSCGAVSVAGQTTDGSGVLLVTGLPAGLYSCTLKATAPDGRSLSATAPAVNVTLDGTTAETVTLLAPISPFVVSVSTLWPGTPQAVGFVVVTVTGVTGYTNGTPNAPTAVAALADVNGCFGISTDGSTRPPVPTTGLCAGDTTMPVYPLRLAAPLASFTVPAQAGYQGTTLTNQPVGSGAVIGLTISPNPVTLNASLTAAPQSLPDLTNATLTVTASAAGSGNITVKVDGTGAISWSDTKAPGLNQIVPGTYTVQVAGVPGYAKWNYTFSCLPNQTCAPTPFQLVAYGTISLTGLPTGAQVQLFDHGSSIATQTASGGTVSFGNLVPTTQSSGATPTPSYSVGIHAAGYVFDNSVPLSCDNGGATPAVAPGATTTCSATLTADGSITGTVTGIMALTGTTPSGPLVGASVTATRCASAITTTSCTVGTGPADGPFATTSDGSGNYTVTGTTTVQGLDTGSWLVTTSSAGYGSTTQVVAVTAGSAASYSPQLRQQAVATYTVTVLDTPGNDPVTDVTVAILQNGTTVQSLSAANSGNAYVFSNQLLPGTYSIRVTGSQIQPAEDDNVTISATANSHQMFVQLGATSVSGTITAVQGKGPGSTGLAGAGVVLGTGTGGSFTPLAKGTDGKAVSTTTDASGNYTLNNVPDTPTTTTYTIQLTHYGYVTGQITGLSVNHSQAPPPGQNLDLTRIAQNATVSITLPTGDNIAAASNPVLTSTTDNTWQYTGSWVSASNQATFTQIPFGCWAFSLTLPANHFGTLSLTTNTPADSHITCSGGFTVTGSATGVDADPGYTLAERPLDLSVTANPIAPDTATNSGLTPLELKLTGGTTTYLDNTGFTPGSTTTLWLPSGSYTETTTATDPTAWPGVTQTITLPGARTQGAVTMNEAAAKLSVSVVGADAGDPATVTLTCTAGQKLPTNCAGGHPTGTDSGSGVAFTNLAPGAWTISVTQTVTNPDHTTTTKTASQTVTLVAGRSGDTGDGQPVSLTPA